MQPRHHLKKQHRDLHWKAEAERLLSAQPEIHKKALNIGAFDFFHPSLSGWIIALLGSISIVNWSLVPSSWVSYMPALFWTGLITIFSALQAPEDFISKKARYCVDITAVLIVFGAVLVQMDFMIHGREVVNAPIQISLVAACSICFHSFRFTVVRNLCLSFLAAATVAYCSEEVARRIVSQFLVGFAFGMIFNRVINRLFFREGFITAKFSEENVRLYGELEKSCLPHQLEMIKGGAELEETMPTDGIDDAIIYKCDIVASTRIKDQRKRNVFHDAVKKVEKYYLASYKSLSLNLPPVIEGQAYYIKPAGDAFFASSKWPFQLPKGMSEFEAVHWTILNSIKILSESIKTIATDPVICCMSAVIGSIDGVFSGERSSYDMAGTGIDLAERYETTRKVFPEIEAKAKDDYHVIILQNKLYMALRKDHEAYMDEKYAKYNFDGNERNRSVRDDPEGTEIYVRFIKFDELDHALEELESLKLRLPGVAGSTADVA